MEGGLYYWGGNEWRSKWAHEGEFLPERKWMEGGNMKGLLIVSDCKEGVNTKSKK